MVDFLSHFPYPSIREIQKDTLIELQNNWEKFDCFIVNAPTAFGKSAISRTLLTALRSASYITPNNLLVQQFLDEFTDTPTLRRLDSYHCDYWKRPCSVTKGRCASFCTVQKTGQKCQASSDLSTAHYRRGPGVYNYHVYLAHRIYRDTLVVDEAHNLIPVIKDRLTTRIWQHDVRYPDGMWTHEQIRAWISSLSPKKQAGKKLAALKEAVTYEVPEFVVQRTTAEFNGKGTIRGEPEMRDCLELQPVDISQAPPMFWPREVQKIVLLSATIGPKDIEALGLTRKRVLYIDCESPIPADRRPIQLLDTVSVSRGNMEQAAALLAEEIERLATHHHREKGVIHATYQMSRLLEKHLTGDRYMFHNRDNKKQQYEAFRAANPADGAILVASGLFEGVDLPEDLGRWQVIAKIPWMSLGNPAVRHLAELDPEYYLWETIKTVIQGCGRICRTPVDFGVTYVLDASVRRIFREAEYMLPRWWLDAIVDGREEK